MQHLRDPEHGCPWDQEQDFDSIAPYTIEEAYEVADAILRKDMADLQDELGDLLFQVVYHAQMASEQGEFQFKDIVQSICQKLIRRHPHVFGSEKIATAQAQTEAWEHHKAKERAQQSDGEHSRLDGVAVSLPALSRAIKLQKRAARAGFDWPDVTPVFEKIAEETDEIRQAREQHQGQAQIEAEVGDLLFAVTNLARHLNVDPEAALRGANQKFIRRFQGVEQLARDQGLELEDMDLDQQERLYQEVKKTET